MDVSCAELGRSRHWSTANPTVGRVRGRKQSPNAHGGGKSDKAIVVKKRTNNEQKQKAGMPKPSSAEFVERRALTERKPKTRGA
jgi:hypothetical protein